MNPPTKNFLVDILAFAGFVLLTSTGVVLRYLLPPGSGRGTTLWGMGRHDWGTVHLWIAVLLLGTLALHLALHARWIASMVCGKARRGNRPEARIGLGLVGLIALLALALAPFFSPVETVPAAAKQGAPELNGSMTLQDVERATGVSATELARALGLPPETLSDERLGVLREAHGFSMAEVRRIVRERSLTKEKGGIGPTQRKRRYTGANPR